MAQNVGNSNFQLQFECLGLGVLSEQDLTVRIQKPDGTVFERLSSNAGEVEAIDDTRFLLGVRIREGDLDQVGTFSYQVIKTTGGVNLATSVGKFFVSGAIPEPTP